MAFLLNQPSSPSSESCHNKQLKKIGNGILRAWAKEVGIINYICTSTGFRATITSVIALTSYVDIHYLSPKQVASND